MPVYILQSLLDEAQGYDPADVQFWAKAAIWQVNNTGICESVKYLRNAYFTTAEAPFQRNQ